MYYIDNSIYGDTIVFVLLVIAFEHWCQIPHIEPQKSIVALTDGNLIKDRMVSL